MVLSQNPLICGDGVDIDRKRSATDFSPRYSESEGVVVGILVPSRDRATEIARQ